MPDCYSIYDWSRSYLLPDHVTANIPRRGGEGEPGAHNNARGLLVEICRATGAHPIALRYAEDSSSEVVLTRITVLAMLPERSRPLPVCTFYRYPLRGQGCEAWSICVDHAYLPRRPPLSILTALASRDRRPLATALITHHHPVALSTPVRAWPITVLRLERLGIARRSAHRVGARGDEPGPSTRVRPGPLAAVAARSRVDEPEPPPSCGPPPGVLRQSRVPQPPQHQEVPDAHPKLRP